MKTIALTGIPAVQRMAASVLEDLITSQQLPLHVRTGITSRADAYAIHTGGGEVWMCGRDAPPRDLVGLIDRTAPNGTDSVGISVAQCLVDFCFKHQIIGEHA
jgi:hypothetical protein